VFGLPPRRSTGENGVLDVLVNNAGVGGFPEGEGLPSVATIQRIKQTFETNVYGSLRVTQAFLPLVRKSTAGRIVNVSSALGSITALTEPERGLLEFPVFAYSSSKTVLNSLTGWLAAELRDTPVKVNSVCPGTTATDINGHYGDQPPSVGAKIIVSAATLGEDGPTGSFFDANGAVGW
jgi:NAD(P)-dependent dehydrogenase (short-subunit alcohol dehydrogenase family)